MCCRPRKERGSFLPCWQKLKGTCLLSWESFPRPNLLMGDTDKGLQTEIPSTSPSYGRQGRSVTEREDIWRFETMFTRVDFLLCYPSLSWEPVIPKDMPVAYPGEGEA